MTSEIQHLNNSTSNGTVFWQLSGSAVSMCIINTKYFPMDKQRCFITLGKDWKIFVKYRLYIIEATVKSQ